MNNRYQEQYPSCGFSLIRGALLLMVFVFMGTAHGAALEITTTSPLASATKGVSYTKSIKAKGGILPYVWSKTSGSLPPGLIFVGGVISGIPSTENTYTFTLKVMDSTPRFAGGPKTKSRTFKLTVGAIPPPVKILWDSSEIDQIKNDINNIVGRLESTLNDTGGLQDVASRVKNEFSAITDTEGLQQLIDDMFGYIQQTISDERTALADFMGGNPGNDCFEPTPCAQFRSDWLSVISVEHDQR